jgi:hypothetical protein
MFVALLVTAGCGSSNHATPAPRASSTTTSTTPAPVAVTAFGATDDVWSGKHKPASVPGVKPGAAYDPDPSLPPVNGQVAARYTFVVHDKGHVVQLVRELPSATAIDEARGFAMQELPSDSKVLWFAVRYTCAQLEVQSAALAQALSANGDGGGFALVEFTTIEPNGTQVYKPEAIGGLRIIPVAASTPSDAPPC